MKRLKYCLLLFAFVLNSSTQAQDLFYTKSGKIRFFSTTPLEDIEAVNREATSFLNTQTGELQFSVLIKGFKFQKALMEEHFNENYMESDKFPKATFKGSITNLPAVDWGKDGTYTVKLSGDLTIHGVTRKETFDGTLTVKGNSITSNSVFRVKPADYGIKIPAIVSDKIAESIEVTVNAAYEPYKK